MPYIPPRATITRRPPNPAARAKRVLNRSRSEPRVSATAGIHIFGCLDDRGVCCPRLSRVLYFRVDGLFNPQLWTFSTSNRAPTFACEDWRGLASSPPTWLPPRS